MPATSCRRGHPRNTENTENTYVDGAGKAHCRVCDRDRRRATYVSTGKQGGPRPTTPPAIRFERFVDRAGPIPLRRPDLGPCWPWLGAPNEDGYGRFRVCTGKMTLAHIWSFEAVNGPVPRRPGTRPPMQQSYLREPNAPGAGHARGERSSGSRRRGHTRAPCGAKGGDEWLLSS